MGRRLVASAAVLYVAAICPVAASAAVAGFGLQTLTLQEASDSQAAGIGCSWSLPGERGMRFAATDDHAVVKVDGRVVKLTPSKGAKDMFPFTFDRWTGGGMSVAVEKVAPSKVRGGSVLAGRTRLVVRRGGDVALVSGTMECGG